MPSSEEKNEFEQAGDDKPLSLVQEFAIFVTENKNEILPLIRFFLFRLKFDHTRIKPIEYSHVVHIYDQTN